MLLTEMADIVGIVSATIGGVVIGIRNQLDLLGLLIVSFLSALGGGLIRDIILGVPPYALTDIVPGILVLLTLLIFVLYLKKRKIKKNLENDRLFVLSDTIGLVSFAIAGALLGLKHEFTIFGVIVLSFITSLGGGILRDMLINKVPFVLTNNFYGSVSIILAICIFTIDNFGILNEVSISMVFIFGVILRTVAVKRNWQLPKIYE
jgi:uncharacterized membrane protein YeiH